MLGWTALYFQDLCSRPAELFGHYSHRDPDSLRLFWISLSGQEQHMVLNFAGQVKYPKAIESLVERLCLV